MNDFKHILDKAEQSHQFEYMTHTDFLDLNEQNILFSHRKELPSKFYVLFGGFESAERKVVVFYPEYMSIDDIEWPFKCLQIKAMSGSSLLGLSHRDYLGSILGLGLKRQVIGDIIVQDEVAYVFVMEQMVDFVLEQLRIINQTVVMINKLTRNFSQDRFQPKVQRIRNSVSSIRLDSVVKLAFPMSRQDASDLIKRGRVYINSALNEQAAARVHLGDVISVRGFGKLKLAEIGETTKKGRTFIEIHKYI